MISISNIGSKFNVFDIKNIQEGRLGKKNHVSQTKCDFIEGCYQIPASIFIHDQYMLL